MKEKISSLSEKILSEIKLANNLVEIEKIRVSSIGKKGDVTLLMQELKNADKDERRALGLLFNELKVTIENALTEKTKILEEKRLNDIINSIESIDLSLPMKEKEGSLHPITLVQKEVEDVFISMGFIVEDGNEIESEYNNFEAVNVPKNHPARDMQDTFWLNTGEVLKTHTSASQNRLMKKYGAPLKVIFPGRCFRNENVDASHENTFFQLEGMMIGEDVNISNLIYFMKKMLSEVFKKEVAVRLRPGFFPFVEPGFELDASCPFCDGKGCATCKQGGWIELCPCGMIHPSVLEMGGIDTKKHQGFAFGLGLTRLAMLKYGIKEIRTFNSGNLRFLSQMKTK